MDTMKVRDVTLYEAVRHVASRALAHTFDFHTPNWGLTPGVRAVVGDRPDDFSVVRFDDHTAIAVITTHRGPLSDVTPDIEITTSILIVENWPMFASVAG